VGDGERDVVVLVEGAETAGFVDGRNGRLEGG